ncbi:hypothetical protein INT46_010605 [Mucor plumbeus]|uniref:Uncharacterized protein n=1 Tax=Mucor plumbeus TaxID=97098 RepID=A0A8H7RIS8_9FUNG|nr:hypothetical protein INT46_010605 [Mucor plumbeus]
MTSHQQITTSIISTISTLENDLEEINQAQDNLLEVIIKAQASIIPEEELSSIKSNASILIFVSMDKVAIYNTKLLSLKATMSMLAGRSKQLKDRAAKLQELKMKYLSEIDGIRKMEKEKDQIIAAKTSISTPTFVQSPDIPSSPIIPSPVISSATPSSYTTIIPKLVKKKKKTKARQALIDDSDDGSSWKPKKSLSQQDLLKK